MSTYHDDDPSPPMRLRDILAAMKLAPRRSLARMDPGRDEEGNLTVQMTCDCGTLTEVTVGGGLQWLPGEVGLTCAGCGTPYWIAVA